MTYLNSIIRRTKPMTRCQCAVLAVMNEQWATPEEIWKRHPVYVVSKYGSVKGVCYGTINAILRGLVQQGFAESRPRGKKGKEYRQAK